ncbi:Uncharacterised protein [Mycobacterium tuberculosis]|nr:Uncharacterised protein [Mycobacterium tuberculosis]
MGTAAVCRDVQVPQRADLAGGFLQQAVGGPGDQSECAPEHPEYREAVGSQVAGRQINHRVAAQRGNRGRRADPGYAAACDSSARGARGANRRCRIADFGHRGGANGQPTWIVTTENSRRAGWPRCAARA